MSNKADQEEAGPYKRTKFEPMYIEANGTKKRLIEPKPNYKLLVIFMLTMSIVVLAQKWSCGSQTQVLLSVKFGWTSKE